MQQRHLRTRRHQRQRIRAARLARKVRHPVIQRQYRKTLARGEPRVVGDLDLGIRSQPPRAAIVEFDFQPGGRAGAQPCRFGQRQVALCGTPGVARVELNFDLSVKLAQAGIARLAREQGRGHEQQQKPIHWELPYNQCAGSFPFCPNLTLAGGGPVGTSACAVPISTSVILTVKVYHPLQVKLELC